MISIILICSCLFACTKNDKVANIYDRSDIITPNILTMKNVDATPSIIGTDSIIIDRESESDIEILHKDLSEINELGKIPIMMYHSIVDMKDDETLYVGGNVDKEGYARTAESFRRDLEFYYQNGYRMIRLTDYVDGIIDCEKGYSPIIITFDDGYENNARVIRIDNGEIVFDKNSAIGILEDMKTKYPDFNVTATFFITSKLFRQDYNMRIMRWLVKNGYDIGNHTYDHVGLSNYYVDFAKVEVFTEYEKIKSIIGDKYVNIVALPVGQPVEFNDPILQGIYDITIDGKNYVTKACMKVGWEPEYSPFDRHVNIKHLKRVRAYDDNGKNLDILDTFRKLESERFVSDGDKNTITIKSSDKNDLSNTYGLNVNMF